MAQNSTVDAKQKSSPPAANGTKDDQTAQLSAAVMQLLKKMEQEAMLRTNLEQTILKLQSQLEAEIRQRQELENKVDLLMKTFDVNKI
jgi:hypothetical protein